MKSVIFALFCFFFSSPTLAVELPNKKLSDFEKAVVAICHSKADTKNVEGTGFIASSTGLVVTADHVITDEKGHVFSKLFGLRPNHPEVERYELTVVKRFRKGLKGRDIAILQIISHPPPKNLPYISVEGKAKIGDPVIVVGFPLVFDKVYAWPLFRSGLIASTRYNYEGSSVLILDLGSVPGYSGSPVISARTYKAVGILKGHPTKKQQTDFAVAIVLDENDMKSLK